MSNASVCRPVAMWRGAALLLATRVLAVDPLNAYPPPLAEAQETWEVQPRDSRFAGTVFLDGSGLHGRDAVRRRCGFGVVAVADAPTGRLLRSRSS